MMNVLGCKAPVGWREPCWSHHLKAGKAPQRKAYREAARAAQGMHARKKLRSCSVIAGGCTSRRGISFVQ